MIITISHLAASIPTPPSNPPDTDPYEAALLAASECLLELELILGKVRDERVLEAHLEQAMGSLRFALVQMRLVRATDRGGLSYGFVLGQRLEPE